MAKKGNIFREDEKPGRSETPIAKKTIKVNTGNIYQLEEGKALPEEIPEAFYESFRSEGII